MPTKLPTLMLLSAFGLGAPIKAQTPQFIPGPDPAANWEIGEFGSTGIELRLEPPSFTMRVTGVIAGSPADLSGQISVGQIICASQQKQERADPEPG
ncbi:MAG: hypothetical protein ACPGJR_00470 [Akkermansiaceae bacterium]